LIDIGFNRWFFRIGLISYWTVFLDLDFGFLVFFALPGFSDQRNWIIYINQLLIQNYMQLTVCTIAVLLNFSFMVNTAKIVNRP
jgi:hypothetical protein